MDDTESEIAEDSLAEFRYKEKVRTVFSYEVERATSDEIESLKKEFKDRGKRPPQLARLQAIIFDGKLSEFAATNGFASSAVPKPNSTLYRHKAVDSLNKNQLALLQHYFNHKYDNAELLRITSATYPLPYTDAELHSIREGRWYLLKRSHTVPGSYSLSCLTIKKEEHSSGKGHLLKYVFMKKSRKDKKTQTAHGYINRNHGQYLFVGLENYRPRNDTSGYSGTQIISVKMSQSAEELHGIVLTATNQIDFPCAAKVHMYFVSDKTEPTDEHTGVLPSKTKIKELAVSAGIDLKSLKFPDDNADPDWGVLVAI